MLPRKCRGVVTGYAMDRARCGQLRVHGQLPVSHPGLLPSCARLSRHTMGSTEDDHVDI